MAEKKTEMVKSIMVNLGILLILISALLLKDQSIAFYLGLILLALQTLDFKSVEPRKLIIAETIIALSFSIATVVLLIMSRSFGTPQAYIVILLLGAILVTVEAVRKYADL